MNRENLMLFERRRALRDRVRLNPAVADLLLCPRCDINVLVVADSFLYFNDENFGLSDFITILEETSHAAARFIVTRAHRGDPGTERLNGADKNFIFTDSALNGIDVVMMFAAGRTGPLLDDPELKALATFMDNGGGVFATGDHDSLGRAMCGDLMRVRSMRKWFYSTDPNTTHPFDAPNAPDGGSAQRHDTNRMGHDTAFSFNDQSDDVPQEIIPVYETVGRSGAFEIREPHQLLCSSLGLIDVFPDHPHEGECIIPWEHDRVFTYDGTDYEEYRVMANGVRVLPKVIAYATMIPGAEVPEFGKPPVSGGSFGLLSAYDGHLVNVGRVTCDSTWHHFININLTGDDDVSDSDPKSMGFLASEDGEAAFEKIKAYFRNIVLWAAPMDIQSCMRNRRIWNLARRPELLEEIDINRMLEARPDLRELSDIGRVVFELPELDESKCQRRRFALDLFRPELIEPLPEIACLLDPCIEPPGPRPDPVVPVIDSEMILRAGLGSLVLSMAKEGQSLETSGSSDLPSASDLNKMAIKSTRKVLRMVGKQMESEMKRFEKLAPKLQEMR